MSTVVDVFWNPVIQEDQNGIILGYQVILFNTWDEFLQNVTIMNSNQLYYQFKDLEPWVNRSVKVRAFTSKGTGPYSPGVITTFNENGRLIFDSTSCHYFKQRPPRIFGQTTIIHLASPSCCITRP